MSTTNYGVALKKAREDAGLSLRDVGKILDLSGQYINRVEHGKSALHGLVTPERLEMLRAAGVDVTTLRQACIDSAVASSPWLLEVEG